MCERCDNIKEKELTNYTNNVEKVWIEFINNEFILCLNSGVFVLRQQINFCPFCGKELVFKPEPTTLDDITNIFDYLRLLDTFTERNGPEYEKWRYASDYVMKHHDDKNCQEMIKHIEKKFKKNEGD